VPNVPQWPVSTSRSVEDEALAGALAAALNALATALSSLASSFGEAMPSPADARRRAASDAAEFSRRVRSLHEKVEQATFARQSAPMPAAIPAATQLAHRRTA
jgi:hypothetical protein